MLPKASGPKKTEPSLFKRATMGANDIETLWTSIGRMATAPYATGDSVVITPRTDTSSIHYQLVRVDANTGEALDTMALPTSMKPLEAGYGNTGFMFSFDAGYQYGGGIEHRRQPLNGEQRNRHVHPGQRRDERRLQQRAVVPFQPKSAGAKCSAQIASGRP